MRLQKTLIEQLAVGGAVVWGGVGGWVGRLRCACFNILIGNAVVCDSGNLWTHSRNGKQIMVIVGGRGFGDGGMTGVWLFKLRANQDKVPCRKKGKHAQNSRLVNKREQILLTCTITLLVWVTRGWLFLRLHDI